MASGRSAAGTSAPLGGRSRPEGTCHPVAEDPDLAASIPADQRHEAESDLLAPVIAVARGNWTVDVEPEGAGLLLLSGLMLRRVGIEQRYGAELLGKGDLLRPWLSNDSISSLRPSTEFRVLTPVRLARLDERVTNRMIRYPQVSVALIEKAMRRTRVLGTTMAILHQPHLETRLHMLLWLLADRWGRVRPDGTLLALTLTHETLGELIAARRPTVSSTLAELARQGLVTRSGEGFLLHGDPPGALFEIAA